jgi:hypothetical protein
MTITSKKLCLRKSIVLALVIEGVVFAAGLGAIQYLGVEFGARVYVMLHMPSAYFLDYIFQAIGSEGRVSDVVFILSSAIAQTSLYVLLIYLACLFFVGKRHNQS